jgi:hypothetical protein
MVFESTDDYLCYVEAVHLLYYEGIKKRCDFMLDSKTYQHDTKKMNISREEFLDKDQRVKEYFFVIDNTEYPEALQDETWTKVSERPSDGSMDVNIELQMELIYTSNDKFYAWTFVFIIIVSGLGLTLLASMGIYVRQSFVYKRYAKERKEMKQMLLKMKESEYTKFLTSESQKLKQTTPTGINSSIVESSNQLDEDSD